MGIPAAEIPGSVLSSFFVGQDCQCEASKAGRVCRVHGIIFRMPVSGRTRIWPGPLGKVTGDKRVQATVTLAGECNQAMIHG